MTVLFVCVENACRSQMAEGWARRLLHNWSAYSAGSKPRRQVDRRAITVMKEVGIDISGQKPKSFRKLPLQEKQFDYVVTLGCGVECPFIPAKKTIPWDIPDPAGKPMSYYRRIRDLIRLQVARLPWQAPVGPDTEVGPDTKPFAHGSKRELPAPVLAASGGEFQIRTPSVPLGSSSHDHLRDQYAG